MGVVAVMPICVILCRAASVCRSNQRVWLNFANGRRLLVKIYVSAGNLYFHKYTRTSQLTFIGWLTQFCLFSLGNRPKPSRIYDAVGSFRRDII